MKSGDIFLLFSLPPTSPFLQNLLLSPTYSKKRKMSHKLKKKEIMKLANPITRSMRFLLGVSISRIQISNSSGILSFFQQVGSEP